MKEEWLFPGAFVPVDVETTSALVVEIHRLIDVVGGMALAQPEQEPEFFTHNVEQPYDWSEWVCPDPKGYLMKCCDCSLVHEAEFGVVHYKSETEREDCDMVDDPNLQAVFRMRRSEQWSPEDTAHRPGGLAQPDQDQTEIAFEAWWQAHGQFCRAGGGDYEKTFAYRAWVASLATPEKPEHPEQMARLGWQYVECPACGSEGARAFPKPEEQQSCDKQEPCKGENCGSINPKLHSAECFDEHESTVLNIKPFGYFEFVLDDGDGYWREIEDGGIDGKPLYTSPPQRQPLTDAEIWQMVNDCSFNRDLHADKFARAIEAKLKEKNT